MKAKGITIEGLPSDIYFRCPACGGKKFQYLDDWQNLTPAEILEKERSEKIYLKCKKCSCVVHD